MLASVLLTCSGKKAATGFCEGLTAGLEGEEEEDFRVAARGLRAEELLGLAAVEAVGMTKSPCVPSSISFLLGVV